MNNVLLARLDRPRPPLTTLWPRACPARRYSRACSGRAKGGRHDEPLRQDRRTGRSVVHVLPDDAEPSFSYTVGNALAGLPELLVNSVMGVVVSERERGRRVY
jgi:hypothetical protein